MNLAQQLPALFRPAMGPNSISQTGWLVLRLVVSLMMIHNGFDKFADIEGFAEAYVEVIGLPFPIFFSYLAAATETVAAPLVALGLLTRPAALGLFGTMVVAMYHHILVAGFSIPYLELSAIYASCFLFFTINGAGIFSLDTLIAGWLTSTLQGQDEAQRKSLETAYQTTQETVSR